LTGNVEMTILSIQRDYGPNVNIVRIVTDSSPQDVATTGWLALPAIADSIIAANNGEFEWADNDVVLVSFIDPITRKFFANAQFYVIFTPSFDSLNPIPPIFPNLQNITAHAGGGQTNAQLLNVGVNVVTTVAAAGDSLILPVNVLGQTVIVINRGANYANIFPAVGDSINGGAANVPIPIFPGTTLTFIGISTTAWSTSDNTSPVYPQRQGIVAHAGGGQANGVLLSPGISIIATVATAGDSVTLPLNILGQTFIIRNESAANLAIFPPLGANFIGSGTNVEVLAVPGTTYLMIGVKSITLTSSLI
jgi:hypothetical protein